MPMEFITRGLVKHVLCLVERVDRTTDHYFELACEQHNKTKRLAMSNRQALSAPTNLQKGLVSKQGSVGQDFVANSLEEVDLVRVH